MMVSISAAGSAGVDGEASLGESPEARLVAGLCRMLGHV